MTFKELALKILNLDNDFLSKEVTENELLDIVFGIAENNEIVPPKKLELEIVPFGSFPCALEKFKINGIDADIEDFGTCCSCGDCMLSECCNTFCSIEKPKQGILRKYNISLSQYDYICNELEDKLYVDNCGWCS